MVMGKLGAVSYEEDGYVTMDVTALWTGANGFDRRHEQRVSLRR
jgi:hypothetical protein